MSFPRPDQRAFVGSYWEQSVDKPRLERQLIGNALFDVAVIGAGYAGLSTALKLAQAGVSVCVLDAEHVGFGASGRNGGFCCMGGTKLSNRQLIKRFGLEETRKFLAFQVAGINLVAQRLKDWDADAGCHSKGEVYLAHRPSDLVDLKDEAAFLTQNFGIKTRLLEKGGLAEEGLSGPEFHGGLHVPYGFALNPMVYVQALAREARKAGTRIFGKSAVTRLYRDGERWRLNTAHGAVRAKQVVLAGNGYAREDTPKWLHGRTLPAMSSVQVTRPLTDDELARQGWTSDLMASDTRILLHYFRLLPDRRFLFGTRGGLFENGKALAAMQRRARADFDRMFPEWAAIPTDFEWHGNVCLSRRLTPFVGPVPGMDNVFAALGWHGSGIAMASISGEKLAGLMLKRIGRDALPKAVQEPLAKFPVPALRKLYLQGAYWWYGYQDR
ncbi:FAD-binding oxidoreductase [Roseibium denhamense]|uniref:Glycine/D-amino acid oxidase n=1 Tax=Roseibium denhamense TaxID=76305 RepID=A0ABY1P537_9HYPH|nr:FAD-dependent oxidoreductase [Roseibium denhamense]MTI07298.1 FAD-binding oxidoreductase [Roseibium denhamense]SMP25901.1 Glycine/D-amino acid oxidase [Roseibium denhamense]